MQSEGLSEYSRLSGLDYELKSFVNAIEHHCIELAAKELPHNVMSSVESKQVIFNMMMKKERTNNYLIELMRFRQLVIDKSATYHDLLRLLDHIPPLEKRSTLDLTRRMVHISSVICGQTEDDSSFLFSLFNAKINYIFRKVRRLMKPYEVLLDSHYLVDVDSCDNSDEEFSKSEEELDEDNPYYKDPPSVEREKVVEEGLLWRPFMEGGLSGNQSVDLQRFGGSFGVPVALVKPVSPFGAPGPVATFGAPGPFATFGAPGPVATFGSPSPFGAFGPPPNLPNPFVALGPVNPSAAPPDASSQ